MTGMYSSNILKPEWNAEGEQYFAEQVLKLRWLANYFSRPSCIFITAPSSLGILCQLYIFFRPSNLTFPGQGKNNKKLSGAEQFWEDHIKRF